MELSGRISSSVRAAVFYFLPAMWMVSPASAWGPAGHQVVARIAAHHLSNNARQGISELLDVHSTFTMRLAAALSNISNDADAYRHDHKETSRWHFVNIPLAAVGYDADRDCAATPEGDCIIQAIERERNVLHNRSSSKEERRQGLMFLVHLLGDLHQPLHCSDNRDRGGNELKVIFSGGESNLHSVWDNGIIEKAGFTSVEYAEDLLDDVNAPLGVIQAGDPVKWALEAQTIARTNAYKIPANKQLNQSYVKKNGPVVGQQLFRGGLRLAKILNDAFE